jgi:hypothetical protein
MVLKCQRFSFRFFTRLKDTRYEQITQYTGCALDISHLRATSENVSSKVGYCRVILKFETYKH